MNKYNSQISIRQDNSVLAPITVSQIGEILNSPPHYSNEYNYPYDKYMGPIIPGRR